MTEIILLWGLGAVTVVILFCFYALFRNSRVYVFRGKLIDFFGDGEGGGFYKRLVWYKSLDSYDEMLLRFWVWPMSRFVKGELAEEYLEWEKTK